MGIFSIFRRKRDPIKVRATASTGVRYSGGEGKSMEDAIVIHARSSKVGVTAEYAWIAQMHGQKGTDWEIEFQALMEHEGKHFDSLHIKLADGYQLTYYFDISEFFGKF